MRPAVERAAPKPDWPRTANMLEVIQAGQQRPVLTSRLDTRIARPSEQFDVWHDCAASLGHISRLDTPYSRFHASLSNYLSSTMAFACHEVCNATRFDRDKRHLGRYGEDLLVIQLRLSGTETANSFEHGLPFATGAIRLFDLSQPYWSANESHHNLAVLIEKKRLRDRFPHLEKLHGSMLPRSAMVQLLTGHIKSVFEALPRIDQDQLEDVATATLDLVGAALGSAIRPDLVASECLAGPVIQTVKMVIEENLADPALGPDWIAAAVGVSRATLFRLCKPFGSPMELVRQQRLLRARDVLLRDRRANITMVAYSVGYESREAFSRAFKREFGVSAQELRRSLTSFSQLH